MIGESAQQKKYKVVSLENPIAKVLLHERYSVTSLRAVVVGMFKAFSYKGRSCLKVSILVSRYMLFEQFTSERCPMMYVPAGSVIDFVPRVHEFMTETLYVSNELQYCFPRSLFNGDNPLAYYPIFKYVTAFKAKLLNICELPLNKIRNVTVPVFESNEA
nr:MAG TPA: hypothetical protein [Caudoviricetes sp.]